MSLRVETRELLIGVYEIEMQERRWNENIGGEKE